MREQGGKNCLDNTEGILLNKNLKPTSQGVFVNNFKTDYYVRKFTYFDPNIGLFYTNRNLYCFYASRISQLPIFQGIALEIQIYKT